MNAITETIASHKNVYVALAAAQQDMGPLFKGTTNPHFKKQYADLSGLVQAVRPPLNTHGLAFFHSIEDGNMKTIIYHGESDTSIECSVPLIVDKNNMQGYKSATTYAKRIGLESVTGIAPEDDDGNAAASAPPPKQQQQQQQQQVQQKSPQQIRAKSLSDEISAITTEAGIKLFWDEYANEIGTFPQKTQDYFTNLSHEKEAKLVQEDPFMEAAE
tara:strand:- start:2246 stop:2893 length:648 start_codon:yes stop_codon:yes gene_type:complete